LRDPGYFIAPEVRAILRTLLFGSLNKTLATVWQIGHSIAGALAGGRLVRRQFFTAGGAVTVWILVKRLRDVE